MVSVCSRLTFVRSLGRDEALCTFRARANAETAILLHPYQILREFHAGNFDENDAWQRYKHQLTESGHYDINMVTEIYVASRWALDYRPPGGPRHADYIVSTWGAEGLLGPQFKFFHNSDNDVRESAPNAAECVLLLSYRRVSKRELVGPAERVMWLFKAYPPRLRSNLDDSMIGDWTNCERLSYRLGGQLGTNHPALILNPTATNYGDYTLAELSTY